MEDTLFNLKKIITIEEAIKLMNNSQSQETNKVIQRCLSILVEVETLCNSIFAGDRTRDSQFINIEANQKEYQSKTLTISALLSTVFQKLTSLGNMTDSTNMSELEKYKRVCSIAEGSTRFFFYNKLKLELNWVKEVDGDMLSEEDKKKLSELRNSVELFKNMSFTLDISSNNDHAYVQEKRVEDLERILEEFSQS